LLAAVRWLQERGVEAVRGHEVELSERLIDRLESCEEIEWYGPRMVERRVGVFSLRLDGVEPGDLSAILEQQFGILTRSGLHCAPLAHQLLGTAERGGATRISFGPFLTERDVDGVGDALIEIARGVSVPARAILDS
jgi:selenocysteine lyase/cysteine desulfurase